MVENLDYCNTIVSRMQVDIINGTKEKPEGLPAFGAVHILRFSRVFCTVGIFLQDYRGCKRACFFAVFPERKLTRMVAADIMYAVNLCKHGDRQIFRGKI
jgi:hypothetical protein